MANNRPLLPSSRPYRATKAFSIVTILLFAIHPSQICAQLQHPPALATSTDSDGGPTLIAYPTNGDTVLTPTSAALSAIPSATDGADYNPEDDGDKGILNYYFLLLAVFIIIIIIAYWSIARRRRNRLIRLRDNQQSALARDVETWPGRRRGVGARWRNAGEEPAAEEGLDERGEAPPPYLKEPEPAHLDAREGVELHNMPAQEGKPPDYDAGPSGR